MDKLFCFALLCHLFHPYAVAAPAQVAIKPDPDHFTVHALDNLSTVPVHDLAFSAPNAWPGATISYNFDSAATESSLGAEVNTAISRWTVSAPYLRFVKIPNSGVGSKGILTITANACKGCNTGIFGYANQPLAMNLQQGCLLTPGTCGPDQATHEFGHALGLIHEHQRPDRETYVHYSCQNLKPSCINGATMPPGTTCCNPVPNCCLTANNFAIQGDASYDSSGIYDVNSIMHYIAGAFANTGTVTLTSANPNDVVPVNPPSNPTQTDFNRICKLYANWCPKAQQCHNLGCPTYCNIYPPCHSPRCTTDFAPPCCDPGEDNAFCKAQRKLCTNNGCGFLR